jgi:hypothetical protein
VLRHPWLHVFLGLLLIALCFSLLADQERGSHEFAYAPFTPDALPWSAMRGFTWEQLHSHAYRLLLLGPGLVLLGLGLTRRQPLGVPHHHFWVRFATACGVFCVGWMALVMLLVLRGKAIADDELTYSMTAEILARGKLSAPDVGFVPHDVFSVETLDGYTGKYLPGEPLLQILGIKLLGVPALSHLPLTALLLYLWYKTLDFDFPSRTAAIATALLALSPSLILTGATGLTHLTSLFCVVLGGYGVTLGRRGHGLVGALVLGASVAYGFAVRPQVALPVHGVLVAASTWELFKARRFAALAMLFAFLGAGVAAIAWYNHALSGSYTKLPWFLQCVAERYGFGRVWECDAFRHTPLTALENLAVVATRFNGWWLGLPLSLAPFVLWRLLRVRLGGGGLWLAVGIAVLVFEAGYYSTGVSDTGPIYHFELLLPASLVTARVIESAWERFPRHVPALLAAHLVIGTGSFLGEHTARLSRLSHAMHDTTDAVLARIGERPAILFHEYWSTELLQIGWVMDSFPKRYRDPSAPIVTMPRPPVKFLTNVLSAYPGRACYFFHRKPLSGEPELLKCEQALHYFERGLVSFDDPPLPPLWELPTAYKKVADWHPLMAARRRNVVFGKPCILCCQARYVAKYDHQLDPNVKCVDPDH